MIRRLASRTADDLAWLDLPLRWTALAFLAAAPWLLVALVAYAGITGP